jgi:hypothetical protein
LQVYLVQKVGKFADIMEQLARGHLSKGDDVSALVTAEWMTGHMLDWGYAPAFHAKMLSSLNRNDEARDQVTFRERSGNFQGTFRKHLGHLPDRGCLPCQDALLPQPQ